MTNGDVVLELAARVADGERVDWAAAESSVDGAQSVVVRQLRVLEQLAAIHREPPAEGSSFLVHATTAASVPGGAQRAVAIPAADQALFDWGSLRVLERVGGGSFGDVYRAWDLKLNREVALKLLRAARLGAQHTRQAALREAQLLARVRDPHVMAIYGIEERSGQVGIWGEFLRGRTLAAIIQSDGTMSAAEAIVVGDAMCHALSTIHGAGILHRDIKAQNVIRAAAGRYVLADFGLGVDVVSGPGTPDLAGTPIYVAPELFRGEAHSAQSDIYSLGVLLFYLVTGTFPVGGYSSDEIATRHAQGERRRLHELRPDLPAAFVETVEHAIGIDPRTRFQSAAELRAALVRSTAAPVVRPLVNGRQLAIATGVLAAVATAAWLAVAPSLSTTATLPVLTFPLPPPGNVALTEGSRNVAVVAPDGSRIAFVGTEPSGNTKLFIRALSALDTVPIEGSSAAESPFWSPDSRAIGFFAQSHLRRIAATGGAVTTLAEASEERGASWGSDGTILFTPNPRTGIHRVAATGGSVSKVTEPDRARGEIGHWWPRLIPGTQSFLYFVSSNDAALRGIYLGHLDKRSRTRLVGAPASGLYADGFLLFLQDDLLVAQRLDVAGSRLVGEPSPVVRDVAVSWTAQTAVSVSQNGVLVYGTNRSKDTRQMRWYDETGRLLDSFESPARFRNPVLTRSGRSLAVQRYDAALSEIRVYDLERGGWARLGARQDSSEFPVWSPDEHQIAFASQQNGYLDVYAKDLRTTEAPRLLWRSSSDKMPTDWSPDNKWLAVVEMSAAGTYDLWLLPASGGTPRPVARGDSHEVSGKFSPDGRWLAYTSNESDRFEVYVEAVPPNGRRRRASSDGGYDPSWRAPGRLVYMSPSGTLMEVAVPADESSPIPRAAERFASRVDTPGSSRNHYAIDVATGRFLINEPLTDPVSSGLNVLVNWQSASGARAVSRP